jgi:hypothetical protein
MLDISIWRFSSPVAYVIVPKKKKARKKREKKERKIDIFLSTSILMFMGVSGLHFLERENPLAVSISQANRRRR